MKYSLLCLLLSGCCCGLMPSSTDTRDWDDAVAREKRNRQVYALEAGTANVWELEVAYPEGWSVADEDAAQERKTLKEIRRLQELLESKGIKLDTPLQELPPEPPKRAMRTAYTLRFSTIFPEVRTLSASGAFNDARCHQCIRAARGLYVSSFGSVPIDLQTVTREDLLAGVRVTGRGSIESIATDSQTEFDLPPEGQVQLRLVESCPAKLVKVTDSIKVSNGDGVIAVPRYEERSWFELRGATCVGSGGVDRKDIGPVVQPSTRSSPSAERLMLLRSQADRANIVYW
ncbi:MAG: hypothetical protein DI536_24830 [Archangium gephyra]|uniref:Uncharacterized protein n=1 Tax=Archangium gephyra TaxID=48 RepID=A0A2W5T2X8_9BACT|nr:MAG: hypothetical protein DI536_24830 [Archangium gephyra]